MEGETTRGRNGSGRNDSGRTGKWAKPPVTVLPFRLFHVWVGLVSHCYIPSLIHSCSSIFWLVTSVFQMQALYSLAVEGIHISMANWHDTDHRHTLINGSWKDFSISLSYGSAGESWILIVSNFQKSSRFVLVGNDLPVPQKVLSLVISTP